MKLKYYIWLLAIGFMSCQNATNEGKVQEERRDSTEYYHTSYPATKGKNKLTPDTGSTTLDSLSADTGR